jgi:hypothetical protein
MVYRTWNQVDINTKNDAQNLMRTLLTSTILWHVDPLLRNDREIHNYTIAIAK